MDVERTIDFILKTQAKTEVRLGGITKLIQQGMRMLVKNEAAIAQLTEAQKGTDAKLARLADAQKRTDAKLDAKFAEIADAHKELAQEMKELAKAQKETERALRSFMRGQRNGRNGR
ncbi:MAG: hypothetical protein DMG16_18590 [Acidobacteria bacterium]|nr:MAG: hypothetical protein DMG16_18590 [Acidobacteriota bacterium]